MITLTYDDLVGVKDVAHSYIDASAFVMMQCYRPRPSPLLPNLSSLSWTFRRDWDVRIAAPILPFLSPSITTLSILVSMNFHHDHDHPEEIATLWRCLEGRTPNVTNLTVSVEWKEVEGWDEHGSAWLASCKTLQSITVPRHWHSEPIVRALEAHPDLRSIEVDRSEDCHTWLQPDRTWFLSRWTEPDTFPSLASCGFDGLLPEILEAFKTSNKFSRLRSLSFGTEYGPLTLLPEILSLLATQCPGLESIFLDFTSHVENDWIEPTPFSAYRPLLSCRNLTRVKLRHDRPIALQESDIEHMGQAWPRLTELQVVAFWEIPPPNENGHDPTADLGTPMNLLTVFASNLPCLERLGLHFHSDYPPPNPVLHPLTTFASLKTLLIGTSKVPGPTTRVASFLAQLCPPDMEISWNKGREVEDIESWESVAEEFKSLASLTVEVCVFLPRSHQPSDLQCPGRRGLMHSISTTTFHQTNVICISYKRNVNPKTKTS